VERCRAAARPRRRDVQRLGPRKEQRDEERARGAEWQPGTSRRSEENFVAAKRGGAKQSEEDARDPDVRSVREMKAAACGLVRVPSVDSSPDKYPSVKYATASAH
jgi:hypothetical protein